MSDKTALITGVTGQDGSYLAELLLEKGYRVAGLVRRASTDNLSRIAHLLGRLELVSGDLLDPESLYDAVVTVRPDEVYHLGAMSFVPASFGQPILTAETTGLGTIRLLEAIRRTGCRARFYQASSSEMFGRVTQSPQDELTTFHPRSPYGYAKVMAHQATVNYREAYGGYACSGILFNHESPRRGKEFVTRKITQAVAKIHLGLQTEVALGNLEARRDWGYAKDYVECMWRMLQQDEPTDYVIATGESHSVREFAEAAFGCLDMDYREYVKTDPALFRPSEVDELLGDPTKAVAQLGWNPRTTSFAELVSLMVSADLEMLQHGPVTGAW